MALPQLVNNSNAAALVTASGNGEYLLSLLVNKARPRAHRSRRSRWLPAGGALAAASVSLWTLVTPNGATARAAQEVCRGLAAPSVAGARVESIKATVRRAV
ncbi:hypothetical protein RKD27_006209 [Streptomyces sp. SAI-126]|uniref:hypothetical protein n=1 Tax=Streptomyces sp. SAI-126 TaxID=3377732 RepID=UPI003C7EBCD6